MESMINLYLNFDVYLLIVVRLVGFFVLVPIFGGQSMPATVKVGLCLVISVVIMSSENVDFELADATFFDYGLIIAKELFVGLIMGFIVYFIFSIIYYVGQLIDYQIGFSMVSVFDPSSQLQVPITGNFLYFVICAIFLVTNGHYSVLSALFYSYRVLPINSADFLESGFFRDILDMMAAFLVIGYKIALPIVGSVLILDVVLGLLTKAAPQINIFSFGMIFKLLCGLMLLFALMPMFLTVSDYIFAETNRYLLKVIRDMMP